MANIEINEALWNNLSDTDRAQITENLKKNRLLMDGDSIIGNPRIPSPDVEAEGLLDDLRKPACRLACDAAAASAIAATAGLAPVALAAALVVIEAARQACRDSC